MFMIILNFFLSFSFSLHINSRGMNYEAVPETVLASLRLSEVRVMQNSGRENKVQRIFKDKSNIKAQHLFYKKGHLNTTNTAIHGRGKGRVG